MQLVVTMLLWSLYAGRQVISVDDLVARMMDVLNEEHRRRAFGLTIANVLMKDMLPSYQCQLALVPHIIGKYLCSVSRSIGTITEIMLNITLLLARSTLLIL